MTSYLIYRKGSNAANQSMTPKMAVGIVDAVDYDTALRIAGEQIKCYANQNLELVEESEMEGEDFDNWNYISERDAELREAGEGSIIFSE